MSDLDDYKMLSKSFKEIEPEILFHHAAQPIVSESYSLFRDTYSINVMDTVNILEYIKYNDSVRVFLI
ncbi:MAG: GDP-mannose 4,6-dehydratase [Leptospiraceae bacterium]|nr:GDP-mannose 4,6-dehydratase [Leptospiraceae bacterium]